MASSALLKLSHDSQDSSGTNGQSNSLNRDSVYIVLDQVIIKIKKF